MRALFLILLLAHGSRLISEEVYVAAFHSHAADGKVTTCIWAITRSGRVVYFIVKNEKGLVSSKGALSDNEFGPDLNRAQIQFQVAPMNLDLKTTSYGQSLSIRRKDAPIMLEDIKTGIIKNPNGDYIASFWLDDSKKLPATTEEFLALDLAKVEAMSGLTAPKTETFP